MRLLVFSDVHGNSSALIGLWNLLPSLAYDRIAFLGDVFGYYYDQEQCLGLLKRIPNLIWLKGNHDAYAAEAFFQKRDVSALIASYGHSYDRLVERFTAEEMTGIASLPVSFEITCGGKRVGLYHGRPSDPLEGRIYNDTVVREEELDNYDVVVTGHTHCKMNRWIGKTHLLSPGSLGQPRDGKGYGFSILDLTDDTVDFINIKVDNNSIKNEIIRRDVGLPKLLEVLSRENEA